MKIAFYGFLALTVLALASAVVLFWFQNTQELLVSFEVWGGFRRGLRLPANQMLFGAAGVGALLGLFVGVTLTGRLKNAKIRTLKAQLENEPGSKENAW